MRMYKVTHGDGTTRIIEGDFWVYDGRTLDVYLKPHWYIPKRLIAVLSDVLHVERVSV